ncbi:MAG TPA: hypothetical protein EYM69_06730 [Dehalococcoidia bacterium]|nr:hypothetical protein [Dehalococcoidia bacterium]
MQLKDQILDELKGGRNARKRSQPGAGLEQAPASRGCRCKWQECRAGSTWDRCNRHTYYRWRREYGGLNLDQAKRLKRLEQENARLKRTVADLALDKQILKEAAEGNF